MDPTEATIEQEPTAEATTTEGGEGGEAKLSKNALKRLQKGTVKKEKPAPAPKPAASAEAKEKKEKAKKEKAPEEIYVDNTPKGEKKDVSGPFPASYQPKYVEAAWQDWWETCGFYKPDVNAGKNAAQEDKFVLVIPPPNVTGSLHLGHAMTIGVEDTLTRWHRMRGKVTLWVPGTDHAGIATQSVVERRLKKDKGVTRHDLGREEFLKHVWDWKSKYGNRITQQIRFLGSSVDWSREAFTMDQNGMKAVNEAFVRFYEDGLIYRDTRLINWSCSLQSAISDIEVDYLELEGRTFLAVPNHTLKDKYEFGMLTSFAYKVFDEAKNGPGDEEIIIATTRLETMLGDTAVAVHPDDPRYTHLHGKFLYHPFVNRKIPIITDGTLVDMAFGTGAVKVTPAHDPNDYSCGKRHNLEFISMMTPNGKINSNGGKFEGMMRYDARIALEEELTKLGQFHGKVPNKMRLGLCSRSSDIIEPMITPQWYLNCNSMAAQALDAVKKGELTILPSMHEQTWSYWLENIKDWCVSRQLWWGHRIPAYFAEVKGAAPLDRNDVANNDRWIVARTAEDALKQAAAKLSVPVDQVLLHQDDDVLDTWFSSGLFPFSVFGWPDRTDDLEAFFPTSLLETGLDILFFWVARMVMMGIHLTGKLPFRTVYLHAMVRDKYGRKMSKSLGNVIDPLEVINGCTLQSLIEKIDDGNLPEKEAAAARASQAVDFPAGIPECGADALRFGLLAYTVQGRDVNLDIQRVVGYRQFCNKLWNAVRFALTYVTDFVPSQDTHLRLTSSASCSKRDRFVLSKLHTCVRDVNGYMAAYQFAAAASALHAFFLYDFCDVYLELIKPIVGFNANSEAGSSEARSVTQATLYTCLETYLRLLHPLMPFVTEELWQRLPSIQARYPDVTDRALTIMLAPYPETAATASSTTDPSAVVPSDWANAGAEADTALVLEAVHAARSFRVDYKVANHVKCEFKYLTDSADVARAVEEQKDDFITLARAESIIPLEASAGGAVPKGWSLKVVNDKLSVLMNLTGIVDPEAELTRLRKEAARINEQMDQYRRKIAAPGYDKVPAEVRALNAEKLSTFESELQVTAAAITAFESMQL